MLGRQLRKQPTMLACFVLVFLGLVNLGGSVDCFTTPCKNGGTCYVFFLSPYCACPQGTFGDYCEIITDPCKNNPCKNGGTCLPKDSNSYTCMCTSDYIGVQCENHNVGVPAPTPDGPVVATVILYGGDIITMNETSDDGKIEAVAILDDYILEVGSMDAVFGYKGPDTQVFFLNQQTLMPGFIESHHHAAQNALVHGWFTDINGLDYTTYAQVNETMHNRTDELENDPDNEKWAIFFGWDPELVYDLPTLSAKFLDSTYSNTTPIVVIGQSEHVAWVNTPALLACNITKGFKLPGTLDGEVVLDGDHNPTGKLFESGAITLVVNKAVNASSPSQATLEEAYRKEFKHYTTVGLTTVTEMFYTPDMNSSLINATMDPNFPVRIALYRVIEEVSDTGGEELTDGLGDYSSLLFEVGVKLFADGSPHCGTSAVRQPYMYTPLTDTLGFPEEPDYGRLNYETEALQDTIEKHHEAGRQVAIHCHGERASDQVIKVFQQVIAANPKPEIRHRMDHLGLTTEEQIKRAGEANLTLTFFVDQLRFYGDTFKNDIFGEPRVNRWAAVAAASWNNITWTIHQDHPAFPGRANPFASMKTAVTRCLRNHTTPYGPEYRVSIHEALKGYTINAAWQLRREDELGSIDVGKKADFVVLSDNPYHMDPFKLEDIKIIDTFVDGRRNNLSKIVNIANVDVQVLERKPYSEIN